MFSFKNEGAHFHPLEANLYAWARENNYSDHDIIAMLSATIRDKSNMKFWGSMNMLDVLPPAQHVGDRSKETRVSILSTIRIVLIFLPFAITWAAVAFATSAYGNFVAQNEATSVSFFAFWQNGYGLLSGLWQIDTIAILNTLIIGGIIGLTLTIGRLNELIQRDFESGIIEAEDQRRALAMELQNYFHAYRDSSAEETPQPHFEPAAVPQSRVERVEVPRPRVGHVEVPRPRVEHVEVTPQRAEQSSDSISELRELAREMAIAMNEMKSSMANNTKENAPSSNQASSNASFPRVEQTISEITGEHIGSATGLIDHLGNAVSSLGNEAVRAADRISDIEASILDTNDNLTNIVSGLETSIADVKADLDRGLARALDRAAHTIEGVVGEMEMTSNSLKSSARSFQDQLEAFQRSLRP